MMGLLKFVAVVLLVVNQCLCQTDKGIFEFATATKTVRVVDSKIQLWSNPKEGKKSELKAEISVEDHNLAGPVKVCASNEGDVCLIWDEQKPSFKFNVKRDEICDIISAELLAPDQAVSVTISYGDAEWYGGPERYNQEWPVQNHVINDLVPYITQEKDAQAVLEAFWFSSQGDSIYVQPNITLFWSSNKNGDEGLGLTAANRPPYKIRPTTLLEFELCDYNNSVEAFYTTVEKYLGKPTAHPGVRMMTYPTYSTWAREKIDVNQEKVYNFTNSILDHGYLMGTIEIDDRWETCYGTLTVDTERFPDMKQLTDYIHSKGGHVTAWVHPFINTECEFYQQALDEGRLVLNSNGSAVTTWWRGQGGHVDFSNTTTKDWWVKRLMDLKESTGLDGYKFDAGETSFMPQLPEIIGDPMLYPDTGVRNYVETVAEFGKDLEGRVGHGTQDVPIFLRMLDKDSRWGLDNGLQSVITTAFQMGLVGYPFILPDMIGGNAYGVRPPRELYIRWVQANAFLPAMQFSILPWDFDDECATICKKFLDLHTNYTDVFIKASNQSLIDGTPLITPIWWYSPNDPETFAVRDEFMLGDSLLVAPVIVETEIERDIYLPAGNWTSARGELIQGAQWLRAYSAPLDFLPYFTKS